MSDHSVGVALGHFGFDAFFKYISVFVGIRLLIILSVSLWESERNLRFFIAGNF